MAVTNDTFPRLPIGGDDYSLFNKFRRMQSGGSANVAQRMAAPAPQQQPMTRPMPVQQPLNTAGPLRPGYTPPGLDVVYKPPMSDQIAGRMLGIGPGAITPELEANNALKSKAIESTAADKDVKNNIAAGKLGVSQDRADVYRFKAENPGVKIIAPKGGNIQAINSATGEVVQDFGSSGTLSDSARIALEQTNDLSKIAATGKERESLAEVQARHAKELQDARLAAGAAEKTTTTSVKDASGNSMGTRTSTTKTATATALIKMIGPDGKTYNIPKDKVADATSKGMKPVQ